MSILEDQVRAAVVAAGFELHAGIAPAWLSQPSRPDNERIWPVIERIFERLEGARLCLPG